MSRVKEDSREGTNKQWQFLYSRERRRRRDKSSSMPDLFDSLFYA